MKDDMNEKGLIGTPIFEYYLKGCSHNVIHLHIDPCQFFCLLKTYAHISLTPPKRYFGGNFLVFCGMKFEEKNRKKKFFQQNNPIFENSKRIEKQNKVSSNLLWLKSKVLVFPRLRVKQNLGTIIFYSLSHNEEHKDTS